MSVMNAVMAVPGCLAALWAAWKWRQASVVQVDFGWRLPGAGGTYEPIPGVLVPRQMEPVDPAARENDVLAGTLKALQQSSDLNKSAAFWTGVATLLGGIAAVVAAVD